MFELSKSKHIDFLKLAKYPKRFYRQFPFVKKKRRLKKIRLIAKILGLFFVGVIIILILSLLIKAKVVRELINFSLQGKKYSELSVSELKEYKFKEASIYAEEAGNNFEASNEILKNSAGNWLLKSKLLKGQYNELAALISTGQILAETMDSLARIGQNLNLVVNSDNSGLADYTKEEKREILSNIYRDIPELYGVKANIELSIINLDSIKARGLLLPVKESIFNIRDNLASINGLLEDGLPMVELAPMIFGYPSKSSFLVVLQNNDELRPTGGFIGTFGVVKTEDGEIMSFNTHDIYHLDMPVAKKLSVTPPAPLADYLNIDKWYMRDANWSPDWPTAAEKINWFYQEESKLLPPKDKLEDYTEVFDGVVGLTPKVIEDLLGLIGSVNIDGEIYNQKNFQQLLQYKVEKGYEVLGVPSWHRKEVVGQIAEEIKKRIFDKPSSELVEIFRALKDNLAQKNIIVYFFDDYYQEIADEKNWSNEIVQNNDDYFYVVDANMASLKTDAVIDRKITYRLSESSGGLFSNLYVNYKHNGDFDWRTTKYRSYTRIYLPAGSDIIKTNGFVPDSVQIYQEYNKTVVAGFLSINPHEIGNLHIYYKLPPVIKEKINQKNYQLFVQKQPGNNIDFLTVDLGFQTNIKSTYYPTGFNVFRESNNKIRWETNLLTDKVFSLELK